jgi:hypothetical protein
MDEYGRRPWPVSAAAYGLWARAVLRIPLPVLMIFYLANGVEANGRATDYPDGAYFMVVSYAAGDLDNVLWYPLSWLAGSSWKVLWLVGFAVGTAGYIAAGVLVRRGAPLARRAYRSGIRVLALHTVYQAVIVALLVPIAVDAIGTGENVSPLARRTTVVFRGHLPGPVPHPGVRMAGVAVGVRAGHRGGGGARAASVRPSPPVPATGGPSGRPQIGARLDLGRRTVAVTQP